MKKEYTIFCIQNGVKKGGVTMKLKKIMTLLLTGVLLVASTACGDAKTGNGTGKMTLEERVLDSQKKMSDMKSISMDMEMEMNMSAKVGEEEPQEITTKTTGKIDMFYKPMKAKMDMNIDMGELGAQAMQMYMEEKDGKYFTYTGMLEQWFSQEVDATAFEQYNAQENAELYLKSLGDLKEVATEQVNGKEATKIEGVVKGEALEKIMESSGIMESLKSQGMDEELLSKIYKEMGDFKMAIWLDRDNYMVKVEEDMTEMMSKMTEKMLEDTEAAGGVTFTKVVVTGTYNNFNQVEEFEIPEEAKNAQALPIN